MGILEKISEIEHEMSRTQKNKATEYHLGLLKAKLAKYRSQLMEATTKKAEKGEGFDVAKSGDARAVMIGFPSVGKSSLLSAVTQTSSQVASYEFTTLTCIPGVLSYNGANIQLLDLPGIIEGASAGKGRGRQVIAVARTADAILLMLDAATAKLSVDEQRTQLERELYTIGIRLNARRPDVYLRMRSAGGLQFNATCAQSSLTERLVQAVCHEYKIFHAELVVREDISVDQLIDVILDANRVYVPCVCVYNKIDELSIEEVDRLARQALVSQQRPVMVSCSMRLNIERLLGAVWEALDLVRVYTKCPGRRPSLEKALILRRKAGRGSGCTVRHACHAIHRSLERVFRYALVWGCSVRFSPQRVGIGHVLADQDVIQIVKK